MLTAEILEALGVDPKTALAWCGPLNSACLSHRITTKRRLSAFIANVLHETGELRTLVENLNYSPQGLLRTWPGHFTPELAEQLGRTPAHPADQRQIAEHAYGGRLGNGPVGSGDGWLFRGRGCLQITGRANYAAYAEAIGCDLDALPHMLELPALAAESAAAWWHTKGINELADAGDIAVVRRAVNGGQNGIAEVTAYYGRALRLIQDAPPAPEPVEPAPSKWGALLAAFIAIFQRKAATS